MNNNPALSVVIPMYNCETYVNDLLGSLSRQTFKDFEVICVDDGSTDQTLSAIESFCKTDSRFSVITKKNGGAGSARNAGIEVARGKYMMFLDSDDEHFPDFFQEMYETIEKYQADEVFCLCEEINYRANTVKSVGFRTAALPANTLVATESVKDLYHTVSNAPWNAIYRKDLIDKYNLRFSTTKVANDTFFIHAYAYLTKNIMGIHKTLLRIRRYHNSESLTSRRWAHTEDVVSALEQLYSWLVENRMPSKYLEECRRAFAVAINYNASFPYNETFVKAYAACLCKGEMWKGIDEATFYEKYWKIYDSQKLHTELALFKEDATTKFNDAQLMSNRILTIESIEKEAYEKYGRILNPNSSYSKFASLQNDMALLQEESRKNSKVLKKTKKALEDSNQQVDRIKNSLTYKTGYYATWLPKKVYHGLTDSKKNNKEDAPIKVSVIIPVYNVEKYIGAFLDSLAAQKSKDLEFIFIDDCGTDSSMRIVEEYGKKDSRVKIIKNPTNMGPGPSRNKGIEAARGEYLAFADPDDLVTPDCYEAMYEKAISENADVIKGDVQAFDENGIDITETKKHFTCKYVRSTIQKGNPPYMVITSAHWSMLYSHKLLLDKSIRYGNTCAGEDGIFILRVFLKANNLSFYDKIVYKYFLRSSGLVSSESIQRHLASLESLSLRAETLKEKGLTDHDCQYLKNYTSFCLRIFKEYYAKQKRPEELTTYLEKLEKIVGSGDSPLLDLNQIADYQYLKQLL